MKKSAIKLFIICAGILFVFAIDSNAQTPNWNELKAQQNAERISMENMQKETMKNLLESQKRELDTLFAPSADKLQEIYKEQKAERLDINKTFADERTKLTQIHADERKNFLSNQK